MKKYLFAVFIAIMSINSYAQNQDRDKGHGERREAIMALKVGMITEQINLTSEQAEQFWPIYNVYSDEKRTLNRSIRMELKRSSASNLTDEERIKTQDKVLELKEKEIALTKTYRSKLLKVISAKQYADLQVAEENFNRMLLQELRKRREQSDN